MDTFNTEKVQGINHSRMRLVQYHKLKCSLVALTCTLFCSTLLLLPAISSLLKLFLFELLPKIGSFPPSTKVVFIIGNLIVVVLVTATKLLSSKSSSIDVCYYEHVKRSQKRTEGPSKLEVNEGERLFTTAIGEEEEEVMDGHGNLDGGDDSYDDEGGYPISICLSEDLNRRADEFIERVNSQRRLELSLVDRCDGDGEFTHT